MAQQREILSRVPTGVPPLKIVILWGEQYRLVHSPQPFSQ